MLQNVFNEFLKMVQKELWGEYNSSLSKTITAVHIKTNKSTLFSSF